MLSTLKKKKIKIINVVIGSNMIPSRLLCWVACCEWYALACAHIQSQYERMLVQLLGVSQSRSARSLLWRALLLTGNPLGAQCQPLQNKEPPKCKHELCQYVSLEGAFRYVNIFKTWETDCPTSETASIHTHTTF